MIPPVPHRVSVANQVLRWCWGIVWAIGGRCSPRPLHGWRRWLLRLFGARIAVGVHVYPGARIWAPWNLTMGRDSCLADEVDCYNQAEIRIGARATISQRAFLCAGSHDYTDPGHGLIVAPISIGDDAWICAQAIIGPGVAVGEGAVVGAGAVAMRDIPPWMVCAGNPCRPLKPRVLRQVGTS